MTTDKWKMVMLFAGVIPVVLGLQASAIWVAGSLLHREVPAVLAESEPLAVGAVDHPAAAGAASPEPQSNVDISSDPLILGATDFTLAEPEPTAYADVSLTEDPEAIAAISEPLETGPDPETDSVETAEAARQGTESEQLASQTQSAAGQVAEAAIEPAGLQDSAWLIQREPGRFTLQVVTSASPEKLLEFADGNNLPQPQAYYRTVWGKSSRYVYALVAGDYPDSQTAMAAARELTSRHPRIKPWMRSFHEVQSQIQ